ncbi:MAG: hypothetical protein KDK39_17105 [Leptospiraceae bacterium]|nr:hypothetical protein [Leptospiraceae bacterium]
MAQAGERYAEIADPLQRQILLQQYTHCPTGSRGVATIMQTAILGDDAHNQKVAWSLLAKFADPGTLDFLLNFYTLQVDGWLHREFYAALESSLHFSHNAPDRERASLILERCLAHKTDNSEFICLNGLAHLRPRHAEALLRQNLATNDEQRVQQSLLILDHHPELHTHSLELQALARRFSHRADIQAQCIRLLARKPELLAWVTLVQLHAAGIHPAAAAALQQSIRRSDYFTKYQNRVWLTSGQTIGYQEPTSLSPPVLVLREQQVLLALDADPRDYRAGSSPGACSPVTATAETTWIQLLHPQWGQMWVSRQNVLPMPL